MTHPGGVAAVVDLSLDVRQGEFITFLGPSGCGKTTTLRLIAGFEEPDSGRVLLEGEDITPLRTRPSPVSSNPSNPRNTETTSPPPVDGASL